MFDYNFVQILLKILQESFGSEVCVSKFQSVLLKRDLKCNGSSMILFVNIWSVIFALVFATLVGLFVTGKKLFWKARLKRSQSTVF